jgi:hypothetical protein
MHIYRQQHRARFSAAKQANSFVGAKCRKFEDTASSFKAVAN